MRGSGLGAIVDVLDAMSDDSAVDGAGPAAGVAVEDDEAQPATPTIPISPKARSMER
jgi:hypothetical protein